MTRTPSILLLFSAFALHAQQQAVVLLDPARGGANGGAHIADRTLEKQVTLELSGRLASLLKARGFDVRTTRDADVDMTSDARASLANNTRPIACILLYAVPTGSGVHLYTSALRPRDPGDTSAVRWDQAQATFVERSRALAGDLRPALEHARLTVSIGQTWMRPLDDMQCPAVAVEVAPEKDGTGSEDNSYQSHVANAVANTLMQWRGKMASMMPPPPTPAAAPKPVTQTAPSPTAPVPTKPAPAKPAQQSPAPIERVEP